MRSSLRAVATVLGRDLNPVSPSELTEYIGFLEKACLENPGSADLWTCLGVAHAMKSETEKSREALERAVRLAPANFWARLHYAGALLKAGSKALSRQESREALRLASNPVEISLAKSQLKSFRRPRSQ